VEIFPDLEFGLLNGWLLVATFYLIFGVLLLLLPNEWSPDSMIDRVGGTTGWSGVLSVCFCSWRGFSW